MTPREFDKLVQHAMREIPAAFRRKLHNVVFLVEPEPPTPGLLGLYHGRPLPQRSVSDGFTLPDRIIIYQGTHERLARTSQELEQMVKDTVWHEIAHYFGMDEAQVRLAERRRERARSGAPDWRKPRED
ncbi:MAG: metallopeptidase family protein [Acidobacteriia bacterium]|nr:metallopeptidase family protein [Terriglobia bacterium]